MINNEKPDSDLVRELKSCVLPEEDSRAHIWNPAIYTALHIIEQSEKELKARTRYCKWPMCESKEVQDQAGKDAADALFGPHRDELIPMGDDQWYFDCDGHYIDVEKDAQGKYSIFFKDRKTRKESWLDQADDTRKSPEISEKWAEGKVEEFYAALAPYEQQEKAEENPWIEWGGGHAPNILDEDYLEIKFRNGSIVKAGCRRGWRWKHSNCKNDIIAYRLSQ